MLYFLDEEGRFYKMKKYFYKRYRIMYGSFDSLIIKKIEDFLNQGEYDSFSISTRYPNPWPPELSPIYDRFDYNLSKEFLGVLQFNLLVEDSRRWFSTKTRLQHRELSTMFYSPLQCTF